MLAIIVGAVIGSNKGRAGLGFVLGLLLGWIGVIIIAVLEPSAAVQVEREHRFAHAIASANAGPTLAGGAQGGVALRERLRELQELHADGVIDDQEHADARARVLARG
ncbi:MAG: SHOCT domain-containing protein [Deltaproteobacteria bacterium]|nr:MAG: SHOCT domain-containing protein [Deltaproteobacteria bacterium]